MRKPIIGIIGAGAADSIQLKLAEEVGTRIAKENIVLVCGGMGGVMEAVSKGCFTAGGEVLGILPGPDGLEANPYVTIAIATNMGHSRNIIIAHTADILIAIGGEFGTLSELAIALKLGKTVISLGSWSEIDQLKQVETPEEAITLALNELKKLKQKK